MTSGLVSWMHCMNSFFTLLFPNFLTQHEFPYSLIIVLPPSHCLVSKFMIPLSALLLSRGLEGYDLKIMECKSICSEKDYSIVKQCGVAHENNLVTRLPSVTVGFLSLFLLDYLVYSKSVQKESLYNIPMTQFYNLPFVTFPSFVFLQADHTMHSKMHALCKTSLNLQNQTIADAGN